MNSDVRYNELTPELYVRVRDAVGFRHYSRTDARLAIQGQLCSVVAYIGEIPIGIGRLVGDGRIAFFIKDVAVLPNYQHHHVGEDIIEALILHVRSRCCPQAYLGLMSTPGTEDFYRNLGFIQRPTSSLGSGFVRFVDPL